MPKKVLNSLFPTSGKPKVPSRLSSSKKQLSTEPVRSPTAVRLGVQIRSLRLALGISAIDLAKTSGVSRSMLSRIERGHVSPSIEALDRIAQGLDVPMSRFFVDQISRTDCSYVPAGQGISIDREGSIYGYHYQLLGHLLSGNLFVEPYKVTLSDDAQPYSIFQHPGIKLIHLLSGRVKYRYGSRLFELKPGDTLQFDATALHGAEIIRERPVSYLSIVFTLRE